MIRGLNESPGAYFLIDNEVMKVYSSFISDKNTEKETPGKIINIYKNGIGIVTKDKELVITEIKPFGKKKMPVNAYLNGIKKEDLVNKMLK